MSDRHKNHSQELPPKLEAMLRRMPPAVPTGFAIRATERFALAYHRRQLKRWALLAGTLFTTATVTVWLTILNIGNIGSAVLNGIGSCIACIRSLFTIWDQMPFLGAGVAMMAMLTTLFLGGIVSKLDKWAYSVK